MDEFLIGTELDDEWTIIAPRIREPHHTGGTFSKGYFVENKNGRRGFLKALDLSRIQKDPTLTGSTLATRIKEVVDAFVYEVNLVDTCKRHDRIINSITDGEKEIPGIPFDTLQYVIFEVAEGDVRDQADLSLRFDTAFSLRSLHHIATGLLQLHGENIAHQDIKPSNILVFDKLISKIGDLGHAEIKGNPNPRGDLQVLGDPNYAPVEQFYGYNPPEWNERRFATDCYLLGSMIVFYFSGFSMTALISAQMDPSIRWSEYSGDYSHILPVIRSAFNNALSLVEEEFPERNRETLTNIVRELCDPDPKLRGDPKKRKMGANQYSMESYVSKLANMASRAEYYLKSKI